MGLFWTLFHQNWIKHKKDFICARLTEVSSIKVLLSTRWIRPRWPTSIIHGAFQVPKSRFWATTQPTNTITNLIPFFLMYAAGGLAIADCEVFACGWLKATCPEWWSRLAKAHEDSWGSTSKVWAWLNSHVPHNYRLLPCIWPCPRAKTSPLFAEWPRTQSVPSPGTSMDRKYIQVITKILTW